MSDLSKPHTAYLAQNFKHLKAPDYQMPMHEMMKIYRQLSSHAVLLEKEHAGECLGDLFYKSRPPGRIPASTEFEFIALRLLDTLCSRYRLVRVWPGSDQPQPAVETIPHKDDFADFAFECVCVVDGCVDRWALRSIVDFLSRFTADSWDSYRSLIEGRDFNSPAFTSPYRFAFSYRVL